MAPPAGTAANVAPIVLTSPYRQHSSRWLPSEHSSSREKFDMWFLNMIMTFVALYERSMGRW